MPEELGFTLDYLDNIHTKSYGDLKIYSGKWHDNNIENNPIYLSVAWSGWGKVSAARAATRLISNKFNEREIDVLFFVGVAGAIDPRLKQGDIVISSGLVQHDMDARPMFDRYIIPALNEKFLISKENWLDWTISSLEDSSKKGDLYSFGSIYSGLIATGDEFVSEQILVSRLKEDFKELLCVEMEGAAVAQVAIQERIPWQILRVISDNANESSPQDFEQFLNIYKQNSAKIIRALIKDIYFSPLFKEKNNE